LQAALTGATPVVEAGERPDAPVDDAAVAAWFDDLDEDLGSDPSREPATEAAVAEDTSDPAPAEGAPEPTRADPESEAGLPGTREPLPETGHTRRVEVFDLLRQSDPALGGAIAQRSAFLTAHGTSPDEGATEDTTVDVPVDPAAPQEPALTAEELAATTAGEQPDDRGDRDRRIVELADDGLTHREIAERFDVSRATVSRIVRRHATV
ncbi:MAG TPA: helix-turn-helix domain-containing protein, partial [Isoptericola sp.]|nr:helix-turn-helix domain-containing protein [Isoptericola sp.]